MTPAPALLGDADRTRRSLTEDDRHLIRTMTANGHSFHFVALVIGRSIGTVSTTVFRMRQSGELLEARY